MEFRKGEFTMKNKSVVGGILTEAAEGLSWAGFWGFIVHMFGKHAGDQVRVKVESYMKEPPRDLFSTIVFFVLKPEETEKLRKRLDEAKKVWREDEMITLLCKLLVDKRQDEQWAEFLQAAGKIDDKNAKSILRKLFDEKQRKEWARILRAVNDMEEATFNQLIYSLKHDRIQQHLHHLKDVVVEIPGGVVDAVVLIAKDLYKKIDPAARECLQLLDEKAAPEIERFAEKIKGRAGELKLARQAANGRRTISFPLSLFYWRQQ